jgi:hypothetical protein
MDKIKVHKNVDVDDKMRVHKKMVSFFVLLCFFIFLVSLSVVLMSGCSKKSSSSSSEPVESPVSKPLAAPVVQAVKFSLTSPAFEQGGAIPKKYSCQGVAVSPPLNIEGIPEGTRSLVLLMHDPDAKLGDFSHWVVWNIPLVDSIPEGTYPDGSTQGLTDFNKFEYGGPCPPQGESHHYYFDLYALDTSLDIKHTTQLLGVKEAMDEHILKKTSLMGIYTRT